MKKGESLRYYLVFTVYFILFGVIVALVTSYVNYRLTLADTRRQIVNNAESIYMEKAFYIDQIVKRQSLMLRTLADNDIIQEFIRNPSEHNRNHLTSMYDSIVKSNINLMQMRYIDENGMEMVRVDRFANAVVITPQEKLQNKSDRYYFKEAIAYGKGDVWKSNIDLNMEHGKLDVPANPTFRMATPVYVDGNLKGIVIINIMMSNIFNNLMNASDFDVYICDGDGNILEGPCHKYDWSKYYKISYSIADAFPQYADEILSNSKFHAGDVFSYNLENVIGNGEQIRLIFDVKNSFISDKRSDSTSAAFIIALTVLCIAVPLSWFAAYIPSKLQSKLTFINRELKKHTDIMDKYVITASTDKNQVITRASYAFAQITGYSQDELVGNTNKLIRHPENDSSVYKDLWETIGEGRVWKGDLRCMSKEGESFWLRKIISPDLDENGEIVGYTSIDYDFTASKAVEEMSVTDQLTKISNRRRLDEALEAEMHRFNRYRHDFCVILLDIDHFKNVNDNYGHLEGDNVLVGLAKILKENCRSTDIVGRWGGEEFLIVVPDTDVENCRLLAEKIRLEVEAHEFGAVGHVTASFGIAQYQYGETIARFIVRADNALYKAKQGGRNRTEIAENQL
jgi:diguanylate cyclase (GGDEF)-like protein/PAS domain S-box-containing protein